MMGSVESEGEYDEHPLHKVTLDGFWIGIYEVTQKQYKELFETHSSCFEGDNLPVEEVNIKDIMEFCMKFNKKYKVKVRLPTEAEWEYACRAGTITKYYWGNEINADYCWYRGNSGNQTHPVGEKKPNAWGLHDTCGNVREWCMDYYREDYYKKSPEKNPEGPKYLQSYLEYPNAFCVQRGGSYHRDEWCLRSAARTSALLSEQSHNVGFRLVLEIPE
ncbi:formylglycine-generating enzyme family protein [Candidatus Peregrinibacteria bacterium]|nr:formylglycine-generating enzyme family protein [Candidatus Peregrinibacteria bacterium]